MKLKSLIFLTFAFCLFQPQMIEAQRKRPVKKTTNNTLTSRQIADKVLPSVVLIITQDENDNPISQGSGFVIGQGLIVSNLHVFERATNATATELDRLGGLKGGKVRATKLTAAECSAIAKKAALSRWKNG